MENTIENKAKLFALYWGLEFTGSDYYSEYMHDAWSEFPKYVDKQYLILKPLSSISDEDAIKICEIRFMQDGIALNKKKVESLKIHTSTKPSKLNSACIEIVYKYSWGRELNRIFLDSETKKTNSEIVDKIREMGYAFSYNTLSVEKQIKYGWVKLKGENK